MNYFQTEMKMHDTAMAQMKKKKTCLSTSEKRILAEA